MANVSFSDLTKFIKLVLRDADLTKLSAKMIRRRCEQEFDVDLTPRKQEVDKIIMSCIDERSDGQKNETSDDSSLSESAESASEESKNEVAVPDDASKKKVKQLPREKPPPKKMKKNATPKPKKTDTVDPAALDSDDDDAAVARKLQEEEWNFRRRSAKRVATKRPAKGKKNSEGDDKPKVRKGNSSYSRKCLLSEELAAVVDASEMARHDVVKKMWSIVRERNLFDPSNKQFALCDDQLQKVFGAKRIRMFGMMKYLKHHVKDLK